MFSPSELTVCLDSELEARLRAEVARTGRPVAAIIREILHGRMTLVLDAGAVYAYDDRDDAWHEPVRTLIEGEPGSLALPTPLIRGGRRAARRVAAGHD